MSKQEKPEDEKITMYFTRKDVNAIMLIMNAGVLQMDSMQNCMKVTLGIHQTEQQVKAIVQDGGVVYERLMKVALDKWPAPKPEDNKEQIQSEDPVVALSDEQINELKVEKK